jgi:hypothetical protein
MAVRQIAAQRSVSVTFFISDPLAFSGWRFRDSVGDGDAENCSVPVAHAGECFLPLGG